MGAEVEEGRAWPAVSVIVPVYNTLPYLIACLDSLVAQTISPEIEVITVDDGSTDGSGAILDEYAARHPDLFTVVHQPNSGGPASPCNRGLERARGRFVYFLGADDYLAEDAMEGLVGAADAWNSDIAFGWTVGVNGRYVWQPIYAETVEDLDLYDSLLPFAVSNSKLFRRSLIEEHGLRFPEDLKVGSDQPFTIRAMVHARKISVLTDRVYLYGTRRDDSSNITFSADAADRLHFVTRIMNLVADLLEPGPRRDAVLLRHFSWELPRLFGQLFVQMDDDAKRQLCKELEPLCDSYLTPRILDRLPVGARVRLELARRGDIERLLEVIAIEQAKEPAELATDGAHLLRVLPGLDDADAQMPAELYRARGPVALRRIAEEVQVERLRWRRPASDAPEGAVPVLVVRATAPIRVLHDAAPVARLVLLDGDTEVGSWPATTKAHAGRMQLHAEVDAPALAAVSTDQPASLRVRLDLLEGPVDVPLPLEKRLRPVHLGPFRIVVRPGKSGRATVRRKRIRD